MQTVLAIGLLSVLLISSAGFAQQAEPSPAAPAAMTDGGHYERDGARWELGLYPGGSNTMPQAHAEAGRRIGQRIEPLNEQGQPDAENGRIVIVSAGHSNTRDYFNAMIGTLKQKQAEGVVNPQVLLVNEARGGKIVHDWVRRPRLARRSDVQVVCLLTTYHRASRKRTESADPGVLDRPAAEKVLAMKESLRQIVQAMATDCPNLKIVYLSSDVWRGYAGLEPHVYEEALAVKALIADQISGDPELAFEGPERKAPWLAWGGYIWEPDAPRERYKRDGVHATEAGAAFADDRWFTALSHDPAAESWLLRSAGEPQAR